MLAQGVVDKLVQLIAELFNSHTSRCRWNSAWCWSQLLLSWRHVEHWWRLLSCHYNQVLYCLGKVLQCSSYNEITVFPPRLYFTLTATLLRSSRPYHVSTAITLRLHFDCAETSRRPSGLNECSAVMFPVWTYRYSSLWLISVLPKKMLKANYDHTFYIICLCIW